MGCEGELNCWERICADKNVIIATFIFGHTTGVGREKRPFAGRFANFLPEHKGVY